MPKKKEALTGRTVEGLQLEASRGKRIAMNNTANVQKHTKAITLPKREANRAVNPKGHGGKDGFSASGSSPTESKSKPSTVMKAAKAYLDLGLSVIPIRPDGTKAPSVAWKEFQTRRAERNEIQKWFGVGNGIAIICGQVSGNLEVLDFDVEEAFDAWEAEVNTYAPELLGKLPVVKSPKGYHVYYRCNEGVQGSMKLALRECGGDVNVLIETRGEGAYVLAPPSPAKCHPALKTYQVLRGHLTDIPTIQASEREYLLNIARAFNEYVEPGAVERGYVPDFKPSGNRPGDIFNSQFTLSDWHDLLAKHGWKNLGSRGEVEYWQRPGKSRGGLSATLNFGGSNLFCVFSTNAKPFEAIDEWRTKGVYTPFAAYALLEHGGDFKAAARELAKKGYTYANEDASKEEVLKDTAKPLVMSWREFSAQEFKEEEKILFGLGRREVGLLVAAANVGKTTLGLNVALKLASGEDFPPIIPPGNGPRRVMLIDGETSTSVLFHDIEKMVSDWPESKRELVKDNLFLSSEAEWENVPLTLSDEQHMRAITRQACERHPDLIIIDTLSALFTLTNENDNAEVARRVMRPLAYLARKTVASVLLLHHVGKQSEDSYSACRAYRGRGASTFGTFPRLMLTLQPDRKDHKAVVLSCVKSKGQTFDDVVMRLDKSSRWFSPTGEIQVQPSTTYESILGAVRTLERPVKKSELIQIFTDEIGKSTLGRYLREAVSRGDLMSRKHGWYEAVENAQMLTSNIDEQSEQVEAVH